MCACWVCVHVAGAGPEAFEPSSSPVPAVLHCNSCVNGGLCLSFRSPGSSQGRRCHICCVAEACTPLPLTPGWCGGCRSGGSRRAGSPRGAMQCPTYPQCVCSLCAMAWPRCRMLLTQFFAISRGGRHGPAGGGAGSVIPGLVWGPRPVVAGRVMLLLRWLRGRACVALPVSRRHSHILARDFVSCFVARCSSARAAPSLHQLRFDAAMQSLESSPSPLVLLGSP